MRQDLTSPGGPEQLFAAATSSTKDFVYTFADMNRLG